MMPDSESQYATCFPMPWLLAWVMPSLDIDNMIIIKWNLAEKALIWRDNYTDASPTDHTYSWLPPTSLIAANGGLPIEY